MIQVNEKSNSPAMLRSQCGQPSVNLRESIYKSEKHIRVTSIGVRPCVQLRVYSPVGGSPIK